MAASLKPAAKASPLDKVRVHLELENLENLRVPELRAMLREAGHEAKGSKDELLVALKRMNSSASDSGVTKLKEAEKEPRRSPRRSAPAGSPRRSAPAKSMLPPGGSKLKAPRELARAELDEQHELNTCPDDGARRGERETLSHDCDA